jgi:transcriptional regulator GlxA family with amidase domain
MTIAIVVFDNFTDIDVFLPWDLFNRARLRRKDLVVKFVGTKASHISACGLELKMHGHIDECRDADIVFFGSGSGTRKLYNNEEYLAHFNLDPAKQVICSMCSGALILGGLGLLNGITATTYPTAIDELRKLGVTVVEDQHLVTHGNISTAAGCLAAIDLIGWCLQQKLGDEIKQDVIASILPVGQGQVCMY